jgi:hypothetical protein
MYPSERDSVDGISLADIEYCTVLPTIVADVVAITSPLLGDARRKVAALGVTAAPL